MGDGGLRHAHPGGVVVDADALKVDGLNHLPLVGIELLDSGAETLFIGGAGKECFQIGILYGVVHALIGLSLQRVMSAGFFMVVVILQAVQVDNHGTDFLRNLDLRDFPSDKFVGNLHFVSFPSGSKDGGTQKSLWMKIPTDSAKSKMNAKSQRWGIFTRSAVFITVFQGLMHPIVLMAILDY